MAVQHTKKVYYNKLKELIGEGPISYAQIGVSGISSSKLYQLKHHARKYGVQLICYKTNIGGLLLKNLKKGISYLAIHSDKSNLINFLKDSKIIEYHYYSPKDIAQENLVIPKGKLTLKAGSYLDLFEKYTSIKLTKGFIELLEPLSLLETSKVVGTDQSKLLKLLRKKVKFAKSEILSLVCENKVYPDYVIDALFERDLVTQTSSLIRALEKVSPISYLHTLPNKIALINSIRV